MDSDKVDDLDLQVSRDLFALENHVIALWDDVLASNQDVMDTEGSIRTVVLSSEGVLVTNASRSVGAGGFSPRGVQGVLLTCGRVTLDIVYCAHYLPSADWHGKPRHAVRRHWVKRNMHVIERVERGMVTLIPTSEAVGRQILSGRSSIDMEHGRRLLQLKGGLDLLVWPYPEARVAYHAEKRTFTSTKGIYRQLHDAISTASAWN